MARFKCVAEGCEVISNRRQSPASCPDKNRCHLELVEDATADPAPAIPVYVPVSVPVAPPTPTPPPEVPTPPPPAMPLLRVHIVGQTWPVSQTVTLGRNGDFALDLFRAHTSLSRRHCQLSPAGRAWLLTALSESSPTMLDGVKVPAGTAVTLNGPRHQLLLGDALIVTLDLSSAATAAAPPTEPPSFLGELDEFLKN